MDPLPTTESKPKSGRDLPAAIVVGIGLFAALAVGLFLIPWFFALLVAAALCLGAIEVHRALLLKGMRSNIVPIVVGTAVSVLGGWAVGQWNLGMEPITFVVIAIAGTALACLIARLRGGADGFLRDVAASALIIAYIPLMGVFLALLLGETEGTLRILAIMLCVIASDTGGYAIGSLLGRNKLAPSISPSKTWEGLAGSVLTAALMGVAVASWILPMAWWAGAVLGIATALAAVVGDLVESLIKRDAGIKDMSNFLPGHGGIMDRLDSMLVAIPVGWLVLHLAIGP